MNCLLKIDNDFGRLKVQLMRREKTHSILKALVCVSNVLLGITDKTICKECFVQLLKIRYYRGPNFRITPRTQFEYYRTTPRTRLVFILNDRISRDPTHVFPRKTFVIHRFKPLNAAGVRGRARARVRGRAYNPLFLFLFFYIWCSIRSPRTDNKTGECTKEKTTCFVRLLLFWPQTVAECIPSLQQ